MKAKDKNATTQQTTIPLYSKKKKFSHILVMTSVLDRAYNIFIVVLLGDNLLHQFVKRS